MKTENELKDRCNPQFIVWMCELAKGFDFESIITEEIEHTLYYENQSIDYTEMFKDSLFPLLIHRAVEGWNKLNSKLIIPVDNRVIYDEYGINKSYSFKRYQPENLTALECACLHCLLEIFEEEV